MITEGEIDMTALPVIMNEFPFQMLSAAFVIRKPEYKPEIFGILKTLPWSLWMTILLFLIVMSLIYYRVFKKNYTLDKVSFYTFAVLLRQSSILKPVSMAENLIVYSWVVGAMFICLAYDSVFLTFLTFPPTIPIKDISQLSRAVLKGDYHCVVPALSPFNSMFRRTNQEDLKVIGRDIMTNSLIFGQFLSDFLYENTTENLAFIVDSGFIDI